MGGFTAFPQTGIQIPTKAGAAVLWHNTFSSGTLDEASIHGSCSVISGHKCG